MGHGGVVALPVGGPRRHPVAVAVAGVQAPVGQAVQPAPAAPAAAPHVAEAQRGAGGEVEVGVALAEVLAAALGRGAGEVLLLLPHAVAGLPGRCGIEPFIFLVYHLTKT